jgi:putative flippase GtrA
LGFAVDAGLTLLLSEAARLDALAARVPAFLTASAVTYALNRAWTFQCRAAAWLRGWLHYLVATGVGAFLNYLTYALVVVLLGPSLPAMAFGVALGSIFGLGVNFTLSDKLVFGRGRTR